MKLTEIKKIEEILLVDKPLLRHKIGNLVSSAENGGSFLLDVDLRLKNEKNFEESLEVIAKLAVSNINNPSRAQSFQNELIFYKSIVPLLQEFLKLRGADCLNLFPQYYGGRLTLNSRSKEADQDGIFFLENLKNSDFENLESHLGFDLETTKYFLQQLARLHASFLAIKIKKTEIFKHKIKPYINKSENTADTDEIKRVVSLMWGNEGCVSLIPRIRRAMSKRKPAPREPFSTIIHSNLWTDNIMVKLNSDKRDIIKIVDFQHYDYGSPAADVLFFLFTSVEISVLEGYLDELLRHYHTDFESDLQQFEIEDSSFSLGNFLKEVTIEATTAQFPHVFMKMKKIFSPNHSKEHEERAWYIVQEFAKRNWI
ncbi:uncharacterized protein LOC108917178 [Anoplophora glabripennis]|uniref:uncharacterized protein LOC108917178 n=1 Tax=Anoplophora glabripennis TaxID=217634 RepID=UPI0008758EC2|nr:uncharacterized protein LOC108917178 [Anoplophora glabripennis]